MTIYLLIRHYSDEAVGSFDTTIAAYKDETEAELAALAKDEDPERHPSHANSMCNGSHLMASRAFSSLASIWAKPVFIRAK